MNLVTGEFTNVCQVEDTVQALRNAHFRDADIGIYTRDTNKGHVLADDLGRQYRNPDDVPGDAIVSGEEIFGTLTQGFINLIQQSNLPDDAIDWYRQDIDQGHVLVVVSAGDRMDDAHHILQKHGGTFFHHETGSTRSGEAQQGEKTGTHKVRRVITTTTTEEIMPEEHPDERKRRPAA